MIEPEVLATFPHMELEHFRNLCFWLTFKRPPNGTGTNLTRNDVLEMDLEEVLWWWKFLREAWDAEDNANRRGAR